MINRYQDLVGDGNGSALVPATGIETVALVPEVGAFGPGCGISGAHEANCETLWNTVMSTPSSAMITAARV